MPSDSVSWASPLPGTWLRNFRLGEWLPDPLTPLFETWVLARLEEACFTGMVAAGITTHVTVNGWYFHSPGGSRQILRLARRNPLGLIANFGLVRWRPDLTERWAIAPEAARWEHDIAPRYRQVVADGWVKLEQPSIESLIAVIDEVAAAAGEYFSSITKVAGFAWKAEWALGRFHRHHLAKRVSEPPQVLLSGLSDVLAVPPGHAVHSLDWMHPTLGETETAEGWDARDCGTSRTAELHARRREAEIACTRALASRPRLHRRFIRMLKVAKDAAVRREAQVADFTLGWPLLRACALRLASHAVAANIIDDPDDIFFLTRREVDEIVAKPSVDFRDDVAQRRREWRDQRLLSPPLRIGRPTPADRISRRWHRPHESDHGSAHVLATGTPASPGLATGPVRILRGPSDFARLNEGDVLVATLTTPAWTPLFGRAAALVIEGGNILAHASIIAREYGLPAVVAVTHATNLLQDGEPIMVDGSAGTISRVSRDWKEPFR